MNDSAKSPVLVILIAACICIPFLESWFAGTLWITNWVSPVFMDKLNRYFRIVKLALVILSIYLLFAKGDQIRKTIANIATRRIFILTLYILAMIQIPLLSLGILIEGVSPSNLSYLHKEKNYKERSIYVYTADPGAFAKAYHHFYLKCPLSFNRYELTKIVKMSWMYKYSFEVVDNELLIEDKSESGNNRKIDVSAFKCD